MTRAACTQRRRAALLAPTAQAPDDGRHTIEERIGPELAAALRQLARTVEVMTGQETSD